jgi:rhodanese-related sulfurtransferase
VNYAGDVAPVDAYDAVTSNPDAVIVDVRTRPELGYVGYPDLSSTGKQLIAVEWQVFPTGKQNPRFLEELEAHGVSKNQPVYFLCRSGSRSRFAAVTATAAGYDSAYNIADGFEGALDRSGHRGSTSGWKVSGLPWRQS